MAVDVLFSYVKHHPDILVMKTNLRSETPLHLYVRYISGHYIHLIKEADDKNNVVFKQTLVYQLIESNFLAIFELDSEGLNPLMRASQYGCVSIILNFLEYTQLMECRDSRGRSFMHHLRLRLTDHNARNWDNTLFVCKKILEVPGVDFLTCSQDQDGNNPLHLAILDRDFDLAQLILEQYVNAQLRALEDGLVNDKTRYAQAQASALKESIVNIKNLEGQTVFDLITFGQGIPSTLKDLMEQASRGRILNEREKEAAEGFEVGVLEDAVDDYGDSSILCQDQRGNNFLHLVIIQFNRNPYSFSKIKEFIRAAVERYPELMYQKDCNDDTPFHLAASHLHKASIELFKICKSWHNNTTEGDWLPPWKVKNSRGDTTFHVVARNGSTSDLRKMRQIFQVELPKEEGINKDGETVLHLIARYATILPRDDASVGEINVYQWVIQSKDGYNTAAFYKRDVDGLTPFLRASHCGQSYLLELIWLFYPELTSISDDKGRNMLHYICINTSVDHLRDLSPLRFVSNSMIADVILAQDEDGNTPLHLAIIHHNFEAARVLIQAYSKHASSIGKRKELLTEMKNKDGKSSKDLVKCLGVGIPSNLKELITVPSNSRGRIMDDEVYQAATEGDITALPEYSPFIKMDKFKCLTRDGSSVIHIALRHHHIDFIKQVLDPYIVLHNPFIVELIYLKDSKGDTPLHLAAGLPTHVALPFFEICLLQDDNSNRQPWTVRNSKGNTYLHEAARLCNYEIIFSKLHDTIDLQGVMNDHDETVLHMIARYANYAAKEFLESHFKKIMPLVYVRDFEGFTPILRAAQYGRLGMAMLLIKKCPQSIEIPDNKGRTFLHYMRTLVVDLVDELRDTLPVWKDIFKLRGVNDLRFTQDVDGNTPLHLSIIDGNLIEAKFLMEICLQSEKKQELYIENNDRNTISNLLSAKSKSNIPMVRELKELLNRNHIMEKQLMYKMNTEVYKAATLGDVQIFERNRIEGHMMVDDEESMPPTLDIDYFCSQTTGGSNIIHLALKEGSDNAEQFVKIAIQHFPYLSMRPDNNGDTPIHLAVKRKDDLPLVESLIKAAKEFLLNLDESKKAFHVAPWVVKNYKGNFPIHEALQSGNFDAANALLDCDDEGASLVNDLGETPLHAFANNGFSISNDKVDKFVEALKQKGNLATLAAYAHDIEGRTPLMSAAKSGRLQVVKAILKHHPQSAYIRDSNGKTFLHVLRFTGEDVDENKALETGMEVWKNPTADAQRLVQDNDGNTPLHCAIKIGNSTAAILLTRRCLECKNQAEYGLMNKDGDTIPYLIASHGDVPSEIIEMMQKEAPEKVSLHRSKYGFSKMKMKESANALSVVAALLATITFAAAFQVPGGFSDDGYPILLQNPAFAIFSLANTIAMCSSMLCLFLLLWVMGIGKTHDSLMILDASIYLLRLSFYLTLLTFTAGMFVVTVEKSLWLAILVCVFSFFTFLLTRRSLLLLVSKHGGRTINRIKKLKK